MRKKLVLSAVLVVMAGNVSCCFADMLADISGEADYIGSCQYTADPLDPAYGAINNVGGNPTWVEPGENSIAIMGLLRAAEITGNSLYRQRAELAADYLTRVQDLTDGAWYSQYDFAAPAANDYGQTKYLRHTAEVMMAFDQLGYSAPRYGAMMKAADFLLDCQNIVNKGGLDDGLVAGGKGAAGEYLTERWTSDNSFAYQALRGAGNWAQLHGDAERAQALNQVADNILFGISGHLTDGTNHWYRVKNADGSVDESKNYHDWISYAPLMLDLPVSLDPQEVGEWIRWQLQQEDGSLVWDDSQYSGRKSPGYSFQASLVWSDSDQDEYRQAAMVWAKNSGLWHETGGWVDWVDPDSVTAGEWERFIDTSAYYIMAETGGYDFSANVVPEPSSLLLFLSGAAGMVLKLRKKAVAR